MKSTIEKATILLALLAVSDIAASHTNPNMGQRLASTDPNIAPNGAPDGPSAIVEYRAGWNPPESHGKDIHIHYCVMPFLNVIGHKAGNSTDRVKPQAAWTQPFNLSLVDANYSPLFHPVRVPTPIPANTIRELLPSPWCREIKGATKPPEIYLQVEQRRARVIFDAPPRQSETR